MAIVGTKDKKNLKELVGIVVSDKMNKTIVIQVESTKMHSLYKKRFKTYKKYYAHDENNDAKMGDTVKIRQARPLSKLKRRKLIEVTKKAIVLDEAA